MWAAGITFVVAGGDGSLWEIDPQKNRNSGWAVCPHLWSIVNGSTSGLYPANHSSILCAPIYGI